MEGACRFTPLGLKFFPRPPEWLPDSLVGTHTNDEGQFTAAPFRVVDAESWVLSGTGLQAGDLFGEQSANLPSFDVPGHEQLRKTVDLEGQPREGASGFFTSKVGFGSGAFSILAIGTNPQGPACMVYRDHPASGWVFNSSSIAFPGALFCDESVARILRNLMDDATGVRASSRRKGELAKRLLPESAESAG
jgi:hypothetical protein